MSDVPLFDRLLAVAALLEADQERSLGAMDLTPARAHVLWVIHRDGPAKQSALAAELSVTPRHITTLVDELAAAGLVTRAAHPDDRRAVLVTLTPRGTRTARGMASRHAATEHRLIASLPRGRAAALADDLRIVTEELERMVREESP